MRKKELVYEIAELGGDVLVVDLKNGRSKLLSGFKTVFSGTVEELYEKIQDDRVKKITERVMDSLGEFYLGKSWKKLKGEEK